MPRTSRQSLRKTLSIVGYLTNGLSIICLFLLFTIYFGALWVHLPCSFPASSIPLLASTRVAKFLTGGTVTKKDSISLSYITCLLLFYIVFSLFTDQDFLAGDACSVTAAIAYSLFIGWGYFPLWYERNSRAILTSVFKSLWIAVRFLPYRPFFNFPTSQGYSTSLA